MNPFECLRINLEGQVILTVSEVKEQGKYMKAFKTLETDGRFQG